jgi:flagellar biosynthesis protein FlhF
MGKTTTLAKLAAQAKLRDGRRVGLVTIDTYRLAAVEQLQTYASILEVPLLAVATPDEMADARRRLADCDLVLIDTAGRSPNDAERLAELKRLLDAAEPHETHLVLASTLAEPAAARAVEQFGVLGADRVVLTKLDEAVGFGVVLNVIRKVSMRLSYVTNGQTVPHDLLPADSARLAALILSAPPTGKAGP